MTPRDFVYWLQGHFELNTDPKAGLSPAQVKVIKDHLELVLRKETPPSEGEPLTLFWDHANFPSC